MADGNRGIVIQPRVLLVGGAVALVGVVVLVLFLWMVPNAAAREATAACRGVHGGGESSEKARFVAKGDPLCPGGQPCTLPLPAPDFTATDHNGNPVKLSDLRGKVVLLNFWGSWCGVCKTEKPALEAMAREMANDDFVVVGLASDRSWTDVLGAIIHALAPTAPVPSGKDVKLADMLDAYKRALPDGTGFRVWLDKPSDDGAIGAIAHTWGVDAVPDSVLIDRKGMIQAYFVNKRDWTSSVAQTCLRSVIDRD